MHEPWTEAETDRLRELWGTAPARALAVEHFPGRTRNSLIGQAHRLGLPQLLKSGGPRPTREPPPITKPIPQRATAPKPEDKPVPTVAERRSYLASAVRPQRSRTFSDLGPAECRWPDNVENLQEHASLFCCAPSLPGKPYCAEHHARAFGRTPATAATSRPFVFGRRAA